MIKRIASAAALAITLTACGEPDSLQDISSKITASATIDGTVMVALVTDGIDAGHNDFFRATDLMRRAAQWQVQHGGPFTEISFDLSVPTRTKYSNEGEARALYLNFKAGDLKRVNWKNFTAWDLLNLAEIKSSSRFGRQLVAAYCSDKDSGKYAAPFCLKAIVSG